MEESLRFHLNAPGDFYVEADGCIACTAPENEAPDLMSHHLTYTDYKYLSYHCYFKQQPVTPDEVARACMAIRVSCCGAVRYGGTDPVVLKQLKQLGAADACDHLR